MCINYFTCQTCGPVRPDVVKEKGSVSLAKHTKTREQSVRLEKHPRNRSIESLTLVKLRGSHRCPITRRFLQDKYQFIDGAKNKIFFQQCRDYWETKDTNGALAWIPVTVLTEIDNGLAIFLNLRRKDLGHVNLWSVLANKHTSSFCGTFIHDNSVCNRNRAWI